ncbi:hypothetical protein B0H13DRAFT_2324382 [Mycena leptocephala]|nr:hypothetical protein B0H13DRAFT_2324382 [Mycena leptocephala]
MVTLSPFPLIACSRFSIIAATLELFILQLGCLVFPSRQPTLKPTLGVCIPHSCSTARIKLQALPSVFAPNPPRMRITLDLPLALYQRPTFSVVGIFAPSTSRPRPRTPRTNLTPHLRRTMTSAPARMGTASTY